MKPKFRAWCKTLNNGNGKMLPVLAINFLKERVYIESDKRCFPTGYVSYDDCELMRKVGTDISGVDVFVGDIVKYGWNYTHKVPWVGEVCFGEYDQDGSAGEYSPERVVGVYIKYIGGNIDWNGEPDPIDDYQKTIAICDKYYCDELKVLGNIYENPEMLEKQK
jgi:uncharacterized phage protein (TIGR01671 family)